MIRHLFHFLCALSLLLCLVTMVIWVRSYWIREDVSHQSATRLTSFACSRGELLVATGSGVVGAAGPFSLGFSSKRPG